MMNRKVLFWPLAAMLLTACEKGLVDGIADVAPAGQARIRVQISAGHEREHLDKCIAAFIKVGKELGVLK